jgi:gamma-glutamylputrescine oxidase
MLFSMPTRPEPQHQVFWEIQHASTACKPEPLESDATVDAVVIGAGVAGLMCAQALREAGHSVMVLERSTCGGEASGRTSGFITPDSELELGDLVRNEGPEEAKRLWEFVLGGLEAIRGNIEKSGMQCDYQVQDSLFIANDAKGFKIVSEEHTCRTDLGYASKLYEKADIAGAIGSDAYAGGVRYPGTFGINSYLFCAGMRDMLRKAGVKIHDGTAVTDICPDGVKARGHRVKAKSVIVCTDRFLPELGIAPRDIYHAQTFLSVSQPLSDADVARMFPDKRLMVWDTDLIYQYFRVTGDNRLLLGAASMFYTYDAKARKTPGRIVRKMRNYLENKFPWLKTELAYVWPGLIGVSKDFVPVAGRHAQMQNVYFMGGAAGLPWAAALGRYVAEKIGNDRSDMDTVLRPGRPSAVPSALQGILGPRLSFALAHGYAKYLR